MPALADSQRFPSHNLCEGEHVRKCAPSTTPHGSFAQRDEVRRQGATYSEARHEQPPRIFWTRPRPSGLPRRGAQGAIPPSEGTVHHGEAGGLGVGNGGLGNCRLGPYILPLLRHRRCRHHLVLQPDGGAGQQGERPCSARVEGGDGNVHLCDQGPFPLMWLNRGPAFLKYFRAHPTASPSDWRPWVSSSLQSAGGEGYRVVRGCTTGHRKRPGCSFHGPGSSWGVVWRSS